MPRNINNYVPPEPVKKPSKYKGNIICKVDDLGTGGNVHFYHKETEKIIDCTRLVHFLTGQNNNLFKRKKKLIQNENSSLINEIEDEFGREYGQDILNIIKNGKLRLHLLFNATGGTKYEYDSIVALINYIKKNNGLTEAYGKKTIQGFPALAYIQADTRYALIKSVFKLYPEWYTGPANASDYRSLDSASKETIAKEKEKDRQTALVRSLLNKNASKEKLEAMKDILYKSPGSLKNPPEFSFTGSELFELGVIHRLYTDEEALKKQFEQNLTE